MRCFITIESAPRSVSLFTLIQRLTDGLAYVLSFIGSCGCNVSGFLAQDVLVMKDSEHGEWMWAASISELDGRYLFLSVSRDTARVCIFPSHRVVHVNQHRWMHTEKSTLGGGPTRR